MMESGDTGGPAWAHQPDNLETVDYGVHPPTVLQQQPLAPHDPAALPPGFQQAYRHPPMPATFSTPHYAGSPAGNYWWGPYDQGGAPGFGLPGPMRGYNDFYYGFPRAPIPSAGTSQQFPGPAVPANLVSVHQFLRGLNPCIQ